MKIYECAECGFINLAKDYPECEKHDKNDGMYEVMSFGSKGVPSEVGYLVEAYHKAKK